jgi:hypothetical protein
MTTDTTINLSRTTNVSVKERRRRGIRQVSQWYVTGQLVNIQTVNNTPCIIENKCKN